MLDVFSQPVQPKSRLMVPVTRIQKVPDHLDPLRRQGASFVLHGHVYKVLENMSRGRLKIKHLGIAQA
jgi:hypothetical protein